MLFYIIFGTNLLTEAQCQFLFFSLFLSFAEKEYQTESKGNETLSMIFLGLEDIQRAWSARQESQRRPQGREARPHPCGPPVTPPTYFFRLYILKYPKTYQGSHETTFPPLQPSVPVRSHLGAFFGVLPEGDSITKGFYMNNIASPMKRD